MSNILLIESDSALAHMYQRKFSVSGDECVIVSSKEEALQKIQEIDFAIILLELNLANEDGLEILREIRENPVYNPELKVLIFSTIGNGVEYKRALEFHANGFISKFDYSPDKLIFEVKRYIHQFEEREKNAERLRNGGPVPKNKTVLLVEDEDVFADMFGMRLRNEGYEVDIAVNGVEGFAKALERTYDLIITDMVMPGLNGQELIEKLKNDDRTKSMPIFLFSASISDRDMDSMRCDGMKCFMKTHVTPSELVREVNAFLD